MLNMRSYMYLCMQVQHASLTVHCAFNVHISVLTTQYDQYAKSSVSTHYADTAPKLMYNVCMRSAHHTDKLKHLYIVQT